jgi:hypothetical protein
MKNFQLSLPVEGGKLKMILFLWHFFSGVSEYPLKYIFRQVFRASGMDITLCAHQSITVSLHKPATS